MEHGTAKHENRINMAIGINFKIVLIQEIQIKPFNNIKKKTFNSKKNKELKYLKEFTP